MPGVKVKKCNCKNDFQDAKYGTGMRVMNLSKDDKRGACTVCGTKHEFGGAATDKKAMAATTKK